MNLMVQQRRSGLSLHKDATDSIRRVLSKVYLACGQNDQLLLQFRYFIGGMKSTVLNCYRCIRDFSWINYRHLLRLSLNCLKHQLRLLWLRMSFFIPVVKLKNRLLSASLCGNGNTVFKRFICLTLSFLNYRSYG